MEVGMTREQHDYAAAVVGRISDAVTVPYRPVVLGGWAPQPNDCHNNVDTWAKANPGMTAIRGWVIDSGCTLAAHSVVRDAAGQLFDITPFHDEGMPRNFVEHLGDGESFRRMAAGMPQIIHSGIDQDDLPQQLEALGIAAHEYEGDELA
jgi:hypothetical protein